MSDVCNGNHDIKEWFHGALLEHEPLSRHTSLKVGGPADFFVLPSDADELIRLLRWAADRGLPFLVIGGGYNLLVRDGGFRGVVISLERFDMMELLPAGRVRVGAGVDNQRLVKFLGGNGLAGLEFLCGIPGTVGGALAMNAGCRGHEIMDCVESLSIVNASGVREQGAAEQVYGYRFLQIEEGSVIAGATFQLQADDPAEIAGRVREYLAQRRTSQQVGYPNAGSFFKNPPGHQAWQLIDAAGMRGVRVGDAQVSEVHCNFLVNRGSASARDFLELAGNVKERVRENSGISLEEEVRIVGEDAQP